MPKTLLKIAAISVIFLYLDVLAMADRKQMALAAAKRSLVRRERDFLKDRTMSPELKEFIDHHRKRRQQNRPKREDDNGYYIIEGGQLVPFKRVERREDTTSSTSSAATTSASSSVSVSTSTTTVATSKAGYTVVPLVIPLGENINVLRDSLMEELLKNSLPISDEIAKDKKSTEDKSIEEKRDVQATAPHSRTTITSIMEEENAGESSQEETAVLQKILDDIEGLMKVRGEGNKKEG